MAKSGCGSLVAKVTDSWLACHEFEFSTTEDPPCRGAMHVKSVESSNALPWFGLKLAALKWRWLDEYKWPESGHLVMESIPNKCYCHQEGRPKSPQNIDICTESLLGIKHATTLSDNGSLAFS
ncbi:hypothetical protein TNCV_5104551 [Trichonephila clavipes]|nr:hypothetical protein TNCV_5104551 [Trichonephila clavipes]